MLRRLFTAASAISLVMCVGIVAFWVRSYWWETDVTKYRLTTRGADPADDVGKIGAFDLVILRGRCGVCIEMNSAYIDNDGRWHVSELPTFPNEGDLEAEPAQPWLFSGADKQVYRVYFTRGGFAFYRNDLNPTDHDYHLIVPLWAFALLTAMVPAVWLRRRLRDRRRRGSGFCTACGYDLRASTARCPECGTPISAEAKA